MTHFEFVWGKNHLTFLSAENTKNMIAGQFFFEQIEWSGCSSQKYISENLI